MQTDSAYKPPSFDEADELCSEILDFLIDCGGIYTEVTPRLQTIIIKSIATGQYILYRDEPGNIEHYLCYEINKEGLLHILEHGNKSGRKGMTMIIKELRHRCVGMQGVLWNSKGQGIKTFMHQKGE